ncbi:hypothetical protein D6D54_07505 [Spiroplasma poulsonii]|uniref:Lipoprotein n=1 Tax=Spiroplasma poulsonii TaxID=2138 RepID=A0A433ENK5_9MOLU|nr:lipoprotein [Spiroplasma poulsonii]MBW3059327.1 hypothetical protein [Spiroplasma poulsonii]RUP75877.1 hypothetical protein D6D54_07505 [Spiroplasma poulsonii]
MKKLLSILGAVSLTATGASSVVAWGGGKAKSFNKLNPAKETKPVSSPVSPLVQSKQKVDISLLSKIDSPEKIIAKDIKKVSKDEYLPLIKNKIHEAINNFNKSLIWKNDLTIELNFRGWFEGGHLDLSTPKTGTLWITGINNATGFTKITITLPIATEL